MPWTIRFLTTAAPAGLVLALALAGCSDDGLAPPLETDAASTSGPSGLTQGGTSPQSDTSVGGETTSQATGGSPPTDGTESSTGAETGAGTGADTGTTGEPPPAMTCETADQCGLVDDCCQCTAAHVDDPPPACDLECEQTMCAALGIPGIGVICDDGQCGLEPRDCSGVVACDGLPPACPEGTLPEVGPGGNACWTGACIPLEACGSVPGCEFCTADEACVETLTRPSITYACRARPDACEGTATCECMPADTCELPFDTCAAADGVITCSCPTC